MKEMGSRYLLLPLRLLEKHFNRGPIHQKHPSAESSSHEFCNPCSPYLIISTETFTGFKNRAWQRDIGSSASARSRLCYRADLLARRRDILF